MSDNLSKARRAFLDLHEIFHSTLFCQVGADVVGLAAALTKPLRPLWLSQRSQIWLNEVTHPADLPFTPIILISASLPNARQRRIASESQTDDNLVFMSP